MRSWSTLALALVPLFVVVACVGTDPETNKSSPGGTNAGGGAGTTTTCSGGNDVTACGATCTPCPRPPNGKAACLSGVCTVACDEGFTACGSECRALATDAENCGRCGRTCGGTACSDGRCAVKPVAALSSDQLPVGIAVGTQSVFVRRTGSNGSGSVERVPKTGGTSSAVWSAFVGWGFYGTGIAAIADDVYFTATNPSSEPRVFKQASGSTSAPTSVADSGCGTAANDPCFGLATDGSAFVWSAVDRVTACVGAGCATSTSAVAAGVVSSALDASFAIYATNQGITRCSRTGCTSPTAVFAATGGDVFAPGVIAVRAGTVYFQDNYTGSPDKARVLACPVTGCVGAPKVLVKGENAMADLAIDAHGIYFTVSGRASGEPDGVVKVCRDLENGCGVASEILADKQPQPDKLGVDDAFVYWTALGVDDYPTAGLVAQGAGIYRVGK